MEPEFTIGLLPNEGDRDDYSIRIVGPGDTDYTTKLSMSGSALAAWRSTDSKSAAEFLIKTIIEVIGTAGAPSQWYWFDSYNSAATLAETGNKIRNFGTELFIRGGTISDEFRRLLSASVLQTIESIGEKFDKKFGVPLYRPLDYAFEYSQASEDLGNPPKDLANFLYRLCILSLIIDYIDVRLPDEKPEVLSLQAFKNWLTSKLDASQADDLTATFQMIKNLRKQYPIHNHYERDAGGQQIERKEITKAKDYFKLTGDYESDWLKVKKQFIESFEKIGKALDSII